MRQLLDLKGSAKLPDEVQWSIRMLLPKPGLAAGSVQQAAAVHAGGDGTGIQNALAVLAEHAQQVCAILNWRVLCCKPLCWNKVVSSNRKSIM